MTAATGALVSTNSIDALLDAFALAVVQDPVTVTGQRPTDAPIARRAAKGAARYVQDRW